jgi:exodeoxyribonuclease-3
MSNKIDIKCWNVNGLRAIWKKGFPEWFDKANPDILCLQETKAQEDQLDHEVINFKDYNSYFFSAEKKGYSGVAIYTRHKPIRVLSGLGIAEFDHEGRVIEMEFEKFVLYTAYFPNGGRGPERVKYKLDFYDALFKKANEKRKTNKNIIICGDYNTAHKEIDLARPKENVKTSGFMPEERAWVDKIIEMDYVDIFREYNTNPEQYTYWDQITRARERNVGWRIDYYMISKEMRSMVSNATIHADVMGSDHCPIGLELTV